MHRNVKSHKFKRPIQQWYFENEMCMVYHLTFPRRICTRCCWGRSSRPAWPCCCWPAALAYKQLMMRRQLWRRRSSARITWRSCCRWFKQLWTTVWQLRPFGRCFQFKNTVSIEFFIRIMITKLLVPRSVGSVVDPEWFSRIRIRIRIRILHFSWFRIRILFRILHDFFLIFLT